jgi:transcriptional regulator of acetoin/glycerol metabolism
MTQELSTVTTPRTDAIVERVWTIHELFSPGRFRAPTLGLFPGEATIGRARDNSICIENDSRASRRHAVVRVEGSEARVVDSSANGTFVNGQRKDESVLADGDVVRMGDTFFLVRHRPPLAPAPPIAGLLGDSPAMMSLRRDIELVAGSDASVLIVGETGTGKELVARALHAASRGSRPYVPVNCGAIPHALAEALMFGHVKGAFTGADSARTGYFRDAHGGVLFLDEIGELPAELQPKLLRVLEDKMVAPVGGGTPTPCDVRLVAATNRDLREDAESGRFRGDLYSRLAEITLQTTPLRERREDIIPILESALAIALFLVRWLPRCPFCHQSHPNSRCGASPFTRAA